MLPDVLRQQLQTRPFVPFAVRTGDGERYRIPHPDFAFLSPSGRTLIVYVTDEVMIQIDVFLITALEVPDTAAA
ncbi:MAG: hypothetical protein JSR82_18585 [Verrucomicrobia bacterium]|nr:hypothetical protein [Verrucomicrobiota bacterium]